MAHSTHLYQVAETYYFRCRIPSDLKKWFNGREDFKRSLHTKSLNQARRLLKMWGYKTEKAFTLMRCGLLTEYQIRTLAEEFKCITLAELENDRRDGLRSVIPRNPDELDSAIETNEWAETEFREALALNKLKPFAQVTDTFLEEKNLEVTPSERYALTRELLKKLIEVQQIERERMVGNYQNGWDDRLDATSVTNAPLVTLLILFLSNGCNNLQQALSCPI